MSCSANGSRESIERIAIFPLENLTSTTDLDWVSRVSAAILAYDLTGPKLIHPIRVESIRDARLNRAGRGLEGYFAREHGALAFHAAIADRAFVVSNPADDVAEAMNRLAKDLSPDARSLAGCTQTALRSYGEEPQPDSKCILVYLQWAEVLLARGEREGAARVSSTALALPQVDPIDRAEFQYLSATARAESSARLQALQNLATLLPSDPELLRNVAELQFANREFQTAVQTYGSAVRADPSDAQAWNELGYARTQVHDLAGAREALEQYQKLLPAEDPNGLDSLGEVSFYLGDFASAERYFLEAHQKNARAGDPELVKAAQARMMTGDLTGADSILARRPNWGDLDRAQWEFLTGRRKQAIARLEAVPPNPRVTLQLVLWKAQTGQGSLPQSGNDSLSHALSLLLAGKFAEAAPLLEQLDRAANPSTDGQVRTLLAWSYARTGRTDAAGKLLDLYPIPLAGSGDTILASLMFPRFVELRGEVLRSQKDQQIAAKYAGDLPDKVR